MWGRSVPWSQLRPYLPSVQLSQAVPTNPSPHWQMPVPLMPSRQTPFPKQAFPAFPGQGWHCCPKKPAQHSLFCKPRDAVLKGRAASRGLLNIESWNSCCLRVNCKPEFLALFHLCWSLAMLFIVPGLRSVPQVSGVTQMPSTTLGKCG